MKTTLELIEYGQISSYNLYQFNLPIAEYKTLIEAYRRKHYLNKSSNWLGLGMPSQYKNKYFTPVSKEIPRALNWYKLTDLGIQKLAEIEAFFPVPQDEETKNKINEILFNIDDYL